MIVYQGIQFISIKQCQQQYNYEMQFSCDAIQFQYFPKKHLTTTITFKNTENYEQIYKFKASTVNRFIIKPNSGRIKPGEQVSTEIIIHRDIVENHQNQKIQINYGKTLEDHKSKLFYCQLIELPPANLNLTVVVEQKEQRVKQLETQVKNLKNMPKPHGISKEKGMNFIMKAMIVVLLGLMMGYFGPVKIFKKRLVP